MEEVRRSGPGARGSEVGFAERTSHFRPLFSETHLYGAKPNRVAASAILERPGEWVSGRRELGPRSSQVHNPERKPEKFGAFSLMYLSGAFP